MKNILKIILKFFNLRLNYHNQTRERYLKIIKDKKVSLIFDVGANEGQFSLSVIKDGFKGRIISFEPTSIAYKKLKKHSNNVENWLPHQQVAVGEKNKEVKINIAGNAAISSSILKMGATHEESAPDSKYIKTEIVKLITLDSIFNKYFEENDICLLKIDVQGYEDQVLKGAANCIKKFNLIKLECSLVSLYDGDKTFEYYFHFFKENGFRLYDLEAGFSNPITGQLLQFDAIFGRV